MSTTAVQAPSGGCSFPGCDRSHYAKGHCKTHRLAVLRGATLRPLPPETPRPWPLAPLLDIAGNPSRRELRSLTLASTGDVSEVLRAGALTDRQADSWAIRL